MIKILTDSVASIPADAAREAGIDVITLYVNRDGRELADADMDLDAFYADIYDMVDNIPTSSQPSQAALEAVFEEAAQAGDEVLGVFISTGLSGAYEGAVRAARAVAARNIGFSYALVDSSSCGYDEAWPVFDAVAARAAGEDLEGCTRAVLKGIESTRFLFTPETLTFLQKGGRIGNVTYAVGSMLDMRPVITCNEQGVYVTVSKAKGRRQSLKKAMACAEKFASRFPRCTMAVVNGDAAKEAAAVRAELGERVGHADAWYEGQISPVLVVHTGPGLIGIGVCGA